MACACMPSVPAHVPENFVFVTTSGQITVVMHKELQWKLLKHCIHDCSTSCMPTSSLLCTHAEIVMRPYRWADDGWKHASKRSIMQQCNYQEQATYADVLPDMASGYMLFHQATYCLPEVCRSVVASCHDVEPTWQLLYVPL